MQLCYAKATKIDRERERDRQRDRERFKCGVWWANKGVRSHSN